MSDPTPLGVVAAAEMAKEKAKAGKNPKPTGANPAVQGLYWFIAIICLTSIIFDLIDLFEQKFPFLK